MFKSMGKFFKAIGYFISFKFLWGAERLSRNPGVIKAKYQDVRDKHTKRLHVVKDAVASIMAIQYRRGAELQGKVDEEKKNTQLMNGALARAKQRLAALQAEGKTVEQIKADPELAKHQGAYMSFSERDKQLDSRIEQLQNEISTNAKTIEQHKAELMDLQRQLQDLEREQNEAVADITLANARKEANEVLAGIANDGTAETLQELREARDKAKADAEITSQLAGTDTKHAEREYLKAVQQQESDNEFFKALGLTEETPAKTEPPTKTDPLPE